MCAAVAGSTSSTTDMPVVYGLDLVCKLEDEISQKMPKGWIEDMIFLKANNKCVISGPPSAHKSMKSIKLHYGTEDDDEWRQGEKRSKITVSIGGLIRKLGESNYDAIFGQLIEACGNESDKFKEMMNEIMIQVSENSACHKVMIRLICDMKAKQTSFTLNAADSEYEGISMNPNFGLWMHQCYKSDLITLDEYKNTWDSLMKHYNDLESDDRADWAEPFEYALKHSLNDEYWHPILKQVIQDDETPIALCFTIEDYFEN